MLPRKTDLLGVLLLAVLGLEAVRAESPPYGDTRRTPSPARVTVEVNPPPLVWPADGSSSAEYRVRLSQEGSFPAERTLIAECLPWPCYNAHRKLAPGRWYWQYAVTARGKSTPWSEVLWFDLDDSARTFVTPPVDVLIKACPKDHPRLLATAAELPALRRRAAGTPEIRKILSAADRCVGRKLPDVDRARPKEKGADNYQQHNFAKWASKAFAGDLAGELTCLAPAYLLTGDAKYGRAAVRRALFIAALDPDAETSPKVSDFADGSCMHAMALAYDSCYDLLEPGQRDQLRAAMRARADRFFSRHKSLVARIFNPHVWQHILIEAGEVAFATLGELSEADAWAATFYELWVNRFPPVGGDDGGWAEGLGYEGTNIETMLRGPALFERLAGFDFFDMPWYRNAPYFLLYGWPAGSCSAGFGDGTESQGQPDALRAFFVDALARRFRDPYALWHAQTVQAANPGRSVSPILLLDRLRTGQGPADFSARSPAELPPSRAFYDVGLVAMHTRLTDPPNDVFVAFCSCPFGAYGHMHPCQNAFNVLVGGQRLFANSGYYIAFGDEHYKGWYSATRGHNAILIDGRGQPDSLAAYGRVLRFVQSDAASYCLGDATAAYPQTGLTKARRHVALLPPSTIVVYDELEADHPAVWSWLLHSPAKMTAAPEGVRLQAETRAGRGVAEVFAAQPLRATIDTRFDPPADNWRRKKTGGEVVDYPDQWHATVVPAQAAPKMRFLAVLQVQPAGDRGVLAPALLQRPGCLQAGAWQIEAALATDQKAFLTVTNSRGDKVLSVDADGQPQSTPSKAKWKDMP